MKFKIDQNLPLEFEDILAAQGHDAISVFRQGMNGAADAQLVGVCQTEGRAFITADLDLSDIRVYPPTESPGFIVFRLKEQSRPKQIELLRELLPQFGTRDVSGKDCLVNKVSLFFQRS